MSLLENLVEALPKEPIPVRKVIIGVYWALVSSKFCGLGSTLINTWHNGYSPIKDVGSLEHKSAQELAGWILSDNLLEASIGMAAINSLLDIDENQIEQVNAAEIITRESKDKNLVVIGHFPFVETMKDIARNCWVIEKRPFRDDFPEVAAKEFIPQADIIAITGTAFINHTIEELLSLCRPGSLVMVVGPSTPLSPLLFNYGISFLSGSRVIDEDAAITTILQGAIFPQVKGVRLITLEKG